MKTRKIKSIALSVIILAWMFVWLAPDARAEVLKPGEIVYSRATTSANNSCDTGAVWVVGQDGSNDRFITLGFHPRISPDGRFLMFKRFDPSSLCSPFAIGFKLWIRELATNRETQISEQFRESSGYFFSPETNRGANQIVNSDGAGLCLMNLDGTNRVCANIPNLDPIRGAGHQSVRGTDNLLLVQNFQNNSDGGLYTLNYDNLQNRQKIPNTVGRDLNPSWSNDGQTIVFASYPIQRAEPYFFTNLFKINADGSNRTQLTFLNNLPSGEGFSYSLIWTLDNETIINAAKINGVAGIYRIAADGSGNILGTIPITPGAAPEWVGGIVPAYSEQQVASFGGGLASGDIFSLVGTFGQGFAGQTSIGSTYNFQSGFWHYPPSAAPTAAGALQFSSATYNTNENGGTATITMTRTGGSDGAIGISYATSNGTATAGSDYTAASGTLGWNDGESDSKTFTVSILDDSILEVDETVSLSLTNATGGATLGSPNAATLTIVDDETCSYSISPISQTIAGAGGNASANVTTTNDCAWTATSNDAWLTITSGASGAGNGTVSYSASANTTSSARSGTLTIAGQTLTVTQPVGSPACLYSISPTSQTIAGAGAIASANVTTASGCVWTAASNAAWLTITSGASGIGNGTINYSAAANTTSAARSGTLTIAGQTLTVTQPVGSTGSAINVSIPASLTASQNTTLTVPVNVSNTTGGGITSFDFRLTYDAAVLTPLAAPVEITGTLSSQFEVNVSNPSAGTLIVSGFGTAPLTGSGVLLNFKFNVTGAFPACSALTLTNFGFNEGNPSASITNGQICVIGATVSGAVTYGNSTTAIAVPGVKLTVAGTPAVSLATTDTNGNYTLSGFGNSAYTVTPSKTFDTNNAITSFDASQISKHLVQTITLTAQQLAAADVSGNGAVTSFDASLIAQTVLEIPNPSNTGTWRFTPPSRAYPSITANQTGQNYIAILMGEVSGNWTPNVPFADDFSNPQDTRQQPLDNAVSVSLPMRSVGINTDFTVPVVIGDVTEREISSFDFELLYDSSVIEPLPQAVSRAETLSSEFAVGANVIAPGRLRVSGYSAINLAGSGTLVNLNFRAVGQTGTSSALTWESFLFNEGNPVVIRTDGRISVNTVAARTAFDFDGDGRADISVFRPSDRTWYLNRSASGFSALQFGLSTDRLASADYDGDGQTDIAVYRSGTWYLQRSQAGFIGTVFGEENDIPVPADYDGDGRAEIAVFRPSNGVWYINNLATNQTSFVVFGQSGDKPVAADYNGDGRADIAVFRPSNGTWYTSTNAATNYGAVQFGAAGDKLVPADYDGDGKTDIAVFRPSNGVWYLLQSRDGFTGIQFGFGTDLPTPADYDGDGKTDIAVYRPSNGVWHLLRSNQGAMSLTFGASTDIPIPTAFVP